jgi:ABC-type lipoprotein release transport system permease subunit
LNKGGQGDTETWDRAGEIASPPKPVAEAAPTAVPKRTLRPLAPSTYLLRNLGKTAPLVGVIMLAVMLVAGIIAMIDSIPYSIRTTYNYSQEMVGITPRGDPTQTPLILDDVRKHSPVPIERIVICRVSSTQIHSIVGKWPFYVLGLSRPDMEFYLQRQHSTGITGRLPEDGKPECVVSDPVAKNLDLKIGSAVQGPDQDESWSPSKVRVVGIAHTDRWLIVNPIEYQRENHFPPIDLGMVFARNLHDQNILDHWADEHFKGKRAAVLAYFQIEKNTKDMFKTLFAILDVVIGTLVLVITFMMGMLMNIYQSQRLVEFGLLQAIGYTKKNLLARVLKEATAVIALGWLFGVLLAFAMLNVVRATLMAPKAFGLDTLDATAFRYTIPLPLTILLVATLTVYMRFRKFDPVGVVERRLV